ncbi:MAG: hypothetical protein ACP5E4_00765 [Candidatus Aenigmatarchaeota archaeon]
MSFLRKLFGQGKQKAKKTPEASESPPPAKKPILTRKIGLDEVGEFLSERTAPRVGRFGTDFGAYKVRFLGIFNHLIDLFEKMEEREIDSIVLESKRDITDIIRTSRANYCQTSKKLLGDLIALLKIEEDPRKVLERMAAAFEKLNNISRQAQILISTFRDEMRQIASALKEFSGELSDFGGFVEREYGEVKKVGEARALADELLKILAAQKEAAELLKAAESEYSALAEEIDKIMGQRDAIIKSKEYMHYERLKEDKEELVPKKKRILGEIANEISGLSRYIKKYLHVGSGLGKEEVETVKEILKYPKALVKNLALFEKVLEKTKKNVSKIESDKKKQEKFKENYAQSVSKLRSLVFEYGGLEAEERKIGEEISGFTFFLELNGLDTRLKEIEARQKILEEEKAACNETISKSYGAEVSRLERMLSEICGETILLK